MARWGQTIDALLVQASIQSNKREEADIARQSIMSIEWKKNRRAQKDVDLNNTIRGVYADHGYLACREKPA